MKSLLLALSLFTFTSANAELVRGHFRSNGTYVAPYFRSPANNTPYDNLSYKAYPSQLPGYCPPVRPSYGYSPLPLPTYPSSAVPLPAFPSKDYCPKPLYQSKDYAPRPAYPTK